MALTKSEKNQVKALIGSIITLIGAFATKMIIG